MDYLEGSALIKHITALFESMLRQKRVDRAMDFVRGLREVLFVHSTEIASSDAIVEQLLKRVPPTFMYSVTLGLEVFRVLYDFELGDPHEKRRRCMTLLLEVAEATESSEIIGEIRAVVQDQLSSSSECVREAVQKSLAWIKGPSQSLRQLGLDVVSMLVHVCPLQLRAQKDATRELRPSFLLNQALSVSTSAFRIGFAKLFSDIVRGGVCDVSYEGANDIATDVESALHGEDKSRHFGALALLKEFMNRRVFLGANWNWRKCATCLLTTDWETYSDDECVLSLQVLAQLASHIDCDEIVDGLLRILQSSHDPKHAAAACDGLVLLFDSNGTSIQKLVGRVLDTVRVHLLQPSPPWPSLVGLMACLSRAALPSTTKSLLHKVAAATSPTDLDRGSWLARLSAESGGGWTEADQEAFAVFVVSIDLQRDTSELLTAIVAARVLRRTATVVEVAQALDHQSVEVRRETVLTLIFLSEELVHQNTEHTTTKRLDSVVTKIIEKLLDAAVVDRDVSVRLTIVQGLRSSFDAYLSLPDHIEALCMARNDVAQSVCDEAVRILCRLLPCNPAFVHPQLLRAQEEQLKEMETKDATLGAVFHCVRQLRLMVSDNTVLVQTKPIELCAVERLDRLWSVSRLLTVELLRLFSAVLDKSGTSTQHCDLSQAVEVLLRILQDGGNNLIRCAAVETLCSVVSVSTLSDATLSRIFSVVGTILRDDRNEDDELRRQAPRVIAVIGGFHPARLRTLVSNFEGPEGNLLEKIVALRPHPRYRPHIEETIPSTLTYLLLKVTVAEAADPKKQLDSMKTLGEILFSAPENQKAALVQHVVPTFRKWLLEPERSHLRSAILPILTDFATLLRKFKEVIGAQVGSEILLSVQSLCALPEASQKPLNVLIVRLLDVLAVEMPVQDMREHRWAVEFILQRLSQDKEDSVLVLQVVKSLDSLMTFLRDRDSRNVLPQVLQCIDAFQDRQVNRSCFDFIGGIIEKQPSLAKDCCAQIVHTTIRFIEESQAAADLELPLNTLANLITTVAQRAARFIPPIQVAARARGLGPEIFERALASASQGLHKVKIPALPPEEVFKADGTIRLISSIRLTQKEFENELSTAIRIQPSDFEILGMSNPGGQTVITFRFQPNDRADVNVAAFAKRAFEPTSALRRNLAIVSVSQKEDAVVSCPADFIMCLRQLPEVKQRKRELPWMLWLTSVSNWFLRMSPHRPFKSVAGIASGSHDLSKSIFPFAAGSLMKASTLVDRRVMMTSLAHALTKAPYDIRQAIFGFAEFIEVERGVRRLSLVKNAKKVSCDVERENPDQKFGINYDQEPRGIVVSKLAPDGLGARAGVPVNAVLISINGTQVKTVQQIRTLIAGLNKIQLVLQTVIEERQESEPVPMIDIGTLASVALEAQMHAKAVYFNEILLLEQLQRTAPHGGEQSLLTTVEKLIELYNVVGIPMEGKGVVLTVSAKLAENVHAPERLGFDNAPTLEKLQWWNEALRHYSARPSTENASLVGMLRCYDALGDFDLVLDMDECGWSQLSSPFRSEFGRLRANAAFALGKWDIVDEVFEDPVCAPQMDGVVFAAALFKRKRFDELLKHCRERRESLFEKYCEHFSDSMVRANDIVVEMQHFSHFEELVSFSHATDERRGLLKSLWRKRLNQMSKKPLHMKTTIAINSLVLSQDEDLTSRVECALVCSKHGWVRYADHLLKSLMNVTSLSSVPNLAARDPQVIHAYLKHTHLLRHNDAREMIATVLHAIGAEPAMPQSDVWSKCWMLMGEWSAQDSPLEATVHLKNATLLNTKNANAFHALGVLHERIARSEAENAQDGQALVHVTESMSALFSSVLLSDRKNSVTQDLLRILTLWFRHGDSESVDACFQRGVGTAPNHVWLRVIPQLVARIGISSVKTRERLGELLIKVGSQFPQAFMYPLHVSEKSDESLRQSMAVKVLNAIRSQHDQLIREASNISEELERMAILWPEKWHAQIQAAAVKQDNASAVLATLNQLFDALDHPSTPHERNFEKSYGQYLKRAKTALMQQPPSLEAAWQSLKQVWQQLNSKGQAERKLIMAEVSPTLDSLKNSTVCVPGTFDPWRPAVYISHFNNRVNVLSSKQKPRKFGVVGSDGKQYHFLLKGHEDLRQDERVMQFIELVNSIFSFDAGSMAQGLSITSYAVVPLSDNVGIIGWVEGTETIYKMLETHRKEHSISIYEEVNVITKKGGLATIEDYHKLPKTHRKALLSYVLSNTPTDELSKIIWTANTSCEEWLEYRRVYANTLATMSMVGYVLGLGDRHLNNLMLHHRGAVVHIDFGDCFEVAIHRQTLAEAVPFRLTRFLVAPLGVSGADGSYRHTCEHVMKLLRRHRENLLSILEAFIFDPLINWTVSANQRNERLAAPEAADGPSTLASSVKLREPLGTEQRNQQADSALLRVQAKLSGEDFGGSVHKAEKEHHTDAAALSTSLSGPAFHLESALGKFSDSPKDSVVGAHVLPTSLMADTSRREALDVPNQVSKLIVEATSIDNLAEAFVTGWAPFW